VEAFLAQPKADAPDRQTTAALNERLAALRSSKASLDDRIAKRELPVLETISGLDAKKQLLIEVFASLLAAFFTAVAGGLIFGYGRALTSR
jgi:hypothetical protein